MIFNVRAIAFVAAALVASAAATPATPPIDACILGCLGQGQGCSSFTDFKCSCNSQQFQTSVLTCLQAKCTAADVSNAVALTQQQCAPYINH